MGIGRAYRNGGYCWKDGKVAVAGRTVPHEVTEAVYAFMRVGTYRSRDVAEQCLARLREAKLDPTIADALGERLVEIARDAEQIVESHRVGRVRFWKWSGA